MLMQVELTRQEFIYYGAIAGASLGFLLGLVVLFLGIRRGNRKLGIVGFVCSLIGGAISGLLGIIVAGIFIWLVLKKPETVAADDETASTETPDAAVFDSDVSAASSAENSASSEAADSDADAL